MKTIQTLLLALILAIAFGTPAFAKMPFGPGEKLSYEIYWTVVHAGSATLEVLPEKNMNGTMALGFEATARSTPFVDAFYKVRDRIESWTDSGVNRSLLYLKNQREGTYKKDVRILFDWNENKTYRYARGKLQHVIEQPDAAFDPLSILFMFRKRILYKTMHFAAPVTDGKVSVLGESTVLGRETLETPMGEIPCFKVAIDVKHLSGVFRKSHDAELVVWFSADARRVPVRVKSKVVVGHFSMELVGYDPPHSQPSGG